MIDHLSTYSSNYPLTLQFYSRVFLPLGYRLLDEIVSDDDLDFPTRRCAVFGSQNKGVFWVIESLEVATPRHVAFSAPDRESVQAFYRIAIENGAKPNGEPGLRPHYHADYYASFVIDPDGNDIEAVCHLP